MYFKGESCFWLHLIHTYNSVQYIDCYRTLTIVLYFYCTFKGHTAMEAICWIVFSAPKFYFWFCLRHSVYCGPFLCITWLFCKKPLYNKNVNVKSTCFCLTSHSLVHNKESKKWMNEFGRIFTVWQIADTFLISCISLTLSHWHKLALAQVNARLNKTLLKKKKAVRADWCICGWPPTPAYTVWAYGSETLEVFGIAFAITCH